MVFPVVKQSLFSFVLTGMVLSLGGLSNAQSLPTSAPTLMQAAQTNAVELVNRGVDKAERGDLQGAIANYTQAIRVQPKFSPAYYNRGIAYYKQGDKQAALADFSQAIQVNQSWDDRGIVNAYYNRATVRYDLSDFKGAISDYNQTIRLKPDYAAAYLNRGNVKDEAGDVQGAIADYTQAIRIKSDYANAYYNRGNTYRRLGDLRQAALDLQRAAEFYQRQGATAQYQEAIQLLQTVHP